MSLDSCFSKSCLFKKQLKKITLLNYQKGILGVIISVLIVLGVQFLSKKEGESKFLTFPNRVIDSFDG
ncbi:hypothetical protein AO498_15530 [Algoriphagus sanaruensis]|uniref:Uncharacterized protein n=1 Tax=Algoriphagus sanaruensis TaxID=1727163 RepID=A0A142ERV9_9BACT|nr:hypothetical protein AO498_15530 [Algoriphagus sanaruensis]